MSQEEGSCRADAKNPVVRTSLPFLYLLISSEFVYSPFGEMSCFSLLLCDCHLVEHAAQEHLCKKKEIFFDEQELLSEHVREMRERRGERIAQRPTPFVRRPVCPGHVIEVDGGTASGI